MGIFSGLFRSRDKPQDRTTGSGYAFYFGSTTSGKAVTERSAMQMTAVYSCVRILAEAVAGLSPFTSIATKRTAARRRRWTIRCISCCMTSRTRR